MRTSSGSLSPKSSAAPVRCSRCAQVCFRQFNTCVRLRRDAFPPSSKQQTREHSPCLCCWFFRSSPGTVQSAGVTARFFHIMERTAPSTTVHHDLQSGRSASVQFSSEERTVTVWRSKHTEATWLPRRPHEPHGTFMRSSTGRPRMHLQAL